MDYGEAGSGLPSLVAAVEGPVICPELCAVRSGSVGGGPSASGGSAGSGRVVDVAGSGIFYGRVNGESWDHAYVTFSGPRVKVWRDQGLFSTKPERGFAPIQDAETFSSRMDSLVGLVLGGATRNDWMTSQLESLLVLCAEAKPTPASDIHDDRMQKVMNEVRDRVHETISWNELAQQAGVSPVHFRRLFKDRTGYAPNQYQIHVRMREAADRLRNSQDPVKQIAAEVGYENVYYFTKLFKNRFGLPPARYRRESRRFG